MGIIDLSKHDIADESGVAHKPRDDGHIESTIERMRADRLRPRQISGRDLVPAHIRDRYQEIWQAEDRAALAAAAARPPLTLRGCLRAVWRFLVG